MKHDFRAKYYCLLLIIRHIGFWVTTTIYNGKMGKG